MRQQYHSRPSDQGELIWDVNRLVELAKALPVIEVPLAEIRELDEQYWFPEGSEAPTCRTVADHAYLIAETDLSYPILLSAEGRVMDGMHRVAKAYLEGHETIAAVQFPTTPEPHYIDVDVDTLPYDD
ncbi:MAG: hypothetical protein AAF170_01095 [Bacteroidota bacterium]